MDEPVLTLCRTTVNMHGAKLGAHVLVDLDDPEIARLAERDYLVPLGPVPADETDPEPDLNAGVSVPDLGATLDAIADAVREPESAPVGSQEPPGGDGSPSAGESLTDETPLA